MRRLTDEQRRMIAEAADEAKGGWVPWPPSDNEPAPMLSCLTTGIGVAQREAKARNANGLPLHPDIGTHHKYICDRFDAFALEILSYLERMKELDPHLGCSILDTDRLLIRLANDRRWLLNMIDTFEAGL